VESALRPHVLSAKNVFTHNPWGEYGHEDHVQVNRVVTRLSQVAGTAVWFGNYVSNKSSRLMQRCVSGFGGPYFVMPVDRANARRIADSYVRNEAATWPPGYSWFPRECFVRGPLDRNEESRPGTIFPANYLRMLFDPKRANAPPPGPFKRIRRRLRKLLNSTLQRSVDAQKA
jgi:hypothetical protein